MKGTIDFDYRQDVDIVVARPRWVLDSSIEVMRWHQLHANYFKARFNAPKDMVVVNDAFDVAPRVATLWGSYRAKLHQTIVRLSIGVNNSARVRQSTQTSGVRHSIGSLEAESVDAAVAALVAIREHVSAPPLAPAKPSKVDTQRGFATPGEAPRRKV
jgi:hypothetical protein